MITKNIPDISDNGLLESVRQDDVRSFEEIYKRYWSKLYFYTFNILHDSNVSKDIVQEIFTDLWTKRKSLVINSFSAYIYKAARFQVYKLYRDKKYKQFLDNEFDKFLSGINIEKEFEYSELKNKIDTLISRLPLKRRLIFNMSREDGMSNKEIAEKLNISLQTVKNQITFSLKTIREAVKLFF